MANPVEQNKPGCVMKLLIKHFNEENAAVYFLNKLGANIINKF